MYGLKEFHAYLCSLCLEMCNQIFLAVKYNQYLTTVLKDRAERAARFAKTKEEVEAAKAAALLAKQAEMEVKRDSSTKERRYFISC